MLCEQAVLDRPVASLSLDLDNKWAYLKARGDARWATFPSYLESVVPRILDVLDRNHLSITFFVVGQDAALDRHREVLASIAKAGHEIASHSYHHEPWLHLYPDERIAWDVQAAEEHIERATERRPVGFRGPGYSISEPALRVLARRGYHYDATTFPSLIGPLARAYLLFGSQLTPEQRAQRVRLLGRARDGLWPLKPYRWDLPEAALLEIPVSTMPLLRLPFHFNYVLYLSSYSRRLGLWYFRMALALCRATRTPPSLLLGPLDFLGGDEESELRFCPGMCLPTAYKLELLDETLAILVRHFSLISMRTHAELEAGKPGLALLKPVFRH